LQDKRKKIQESDKPKSKNDELVEQLLEAAIDNLMSGGGKTDMEAITGAIETSVKEVSGTMKEVFGRKKLGKVLEDEKYASDWSKCGACGQMINHPNPKSCPNCGATEESPPGKQPGPQPEEMTTEDIDCFGSYDASDTECQNCDESEKCMAQKKPSSSTFEKVDYGPLPEGAEDFLDEIHRICEWIEDGVDAKTNTTSLYMLGVGNRMKRGRKPKPKNIQTVKGTLLSAEIGMDKLLEIASQFENHPEAQEYEIKEMIQVLKTKKGQGFIHSSWSTLQSLASQDGIHLTNEDRKSMIEDLNDYSIVKLDPEDYLIKEPDEGDEPEPEKKPGKKKSTKKKPGPKKKPKADKKKHQEKLKKIAESTETECPVCHEKMKISELRGHLAECKG
jgi:hypothetical protein